MPNPPEGTYFDLERVIAAPVDRVYAAWITPDAYARWSWGGMGKDVECHIDLRPGGAWSAHTAVTDPMGWKRDRWGMLGRYVEIVPNARLVYTLHWDAPVVYNESDAACPDEIICVDFTACEAGTRVALRHMGIPADPEGISVREHRRGWGDVLDALTAFMEARSA